MHSGNARANADFQDSLDTILEVQLSSPTERCSLGGTVHCGPVRRSTTLGFLRKRRNVQYVRHHLTPLCTLQPCLSFVHVSVSTVEAPASLKPPNGIPSINPTPPEKAPGRATGQPNNAIHESKIRDFRRCTDVEVLVTAIRRAHCADPPACTGPHRPSPAPPPPGPGLTLSPDIPHLRGSVVDHHPILSGTMECAVAELQVLAGVEAHQHLFGVVQIEALELASAPVHMCESANRPLGLRVLWPRLWGRGAVGLSGSGAVGHCGAVIRRSPTCCRNAGGRDL